MHIALFTVSLGPHLTTYDGASKEENQGVTFADMAVEGPFLSKVILADRSPTGVSFTFRKAAGAGSPFLVLALDRTGNFRTNVSRRFVFL